MLVFIGKNGVVGGGAVFFAGRDLHFGDATPDEVAKTEAIEAEKLLTGFWVVLVDNIRIRLVLT